MGVMYTGFRQQCKLLVFSEAINVKFVPPRSQGPGVFYGGRVSRV